VLFAQTEKRGSKVCLRELKRELLYFKESWKKRLLWIDSLHAKFKTRVATSQFVRTRSMAASLMSDVR